MPRSRAAISIRRVRLSPPLFFAGGSLFTDVTSVKTPERRSRDKVELIEAKLSH